MLCAQAASGRICERIFYHRHGPAIFCMFSPINRVKSVPLTAVASSLRSAQRTVGRTSPEAREDTTRNCNQMFTSLCGIYLRPTGVRTLTLLGIFCCFSTFFSARVTSRAVVQQHASNRDGGWTRHAPATVSISIQLLLCNIPAKPSTF